MGRGPPRAHERGPPLMIYCLSIQVKCRMILFIIKGAVCVMNNVGRDVYNQVVSDWDLLDCSILGESQFIKIQSEIRTQTWTESPSPYELPLQITVSEFEEQLCPARLKYDCREEGIVSINLYTCIKVRSLPVPSMAVCIVLWRNLNSPPRVTCEWMNVELGTL